MFDRIPQELRQRRQWLVWRYEKREGAKDTKVPYSAVTRLKASVTNPSDWCSFEEATAAYNEANGFLDGVGFVLTADDEFAVIDLDDTHGDDEAYQRQLKIYNEFQSYSELSPSGAGVHIWLKGSVPHGRKRAFVEVYSSERYMTMTGKCIRNEPVADHWFRQPDNTRVDANELLNTLWSEMGGPVAQYVYGEKQDQKNTDEEVIGLARNAANGDKFDRLFAGNFANEYHSQSEADQALMNILAYYTQNRAQLMRLFRMSELGVRDKAQRDRYLDYTINKAFDRQLPPLDLEGLLIQFKTMAATNPSQHIYVNNEPIVPLMRLVNGQGAAGEPGGTPAAPPVADQLCREAEGASAGAGITAAHGQGSPYSASGSTPFPPGLVGQVAQFIYDAAPRPVEEIALAGAIGFLAGICGRAYNVSGTGLNQYVLTLAPTGTGKEAIAGGTDKLIEAIKTQLNNVGDFVGPGEIVSSAGLIKWLAAKPACYAIVGEFGLKLAEMSSPKANPHLASVKRVLTDLYHKSGKGSIMQPMAYSDKDKNTAQIFSPSLSIIGESVPERFYEVLDESMIADGLLPRFTIIEYQGKRPPRNDNAKSVRPRIDLVEHIRSLAAQCLQLAHNNNVHDVPMSDEAWALFDQFDKWCDDCINAPGSTEVNRQLWNRAHIKALKMAALVAVGINFTHPVIDYACAVWATNEIAKQTNRLLAKFIAGDVGGATSEAKQVREMLKAIKVYMTEPFDKVSKYGTDEDMFRAGVVRYDYLQRRLVSMACFRLDRFGSTGAIKRAIDFLLTADVIKEVPKIQMQDQFGKAPRAFIVSDPQYVMNAGTEDA